MPTVQGWLFLIGAALLGGAGWMFGSTDLLAVGVAGIAVATLATAYVRARPPLQVLGRSLKPQRVHVGEQCQVQLKLANSGRLRSPVLRFTDEILFVGDGDSVGSAQSPDLMIAPVSPGDELRVAYRLPTESRGRAVVGPLTLTLADPFGLANRELRLGGQEEALIYPEILPVAPPARLSGSTFDAVRRSPMAQSGEELYGLRPFQRGDDPRRIHWRSSAHHDELIVRQFEEFSQTHTTVLLDTRLPDTRKTQWQGLYGRERFEAMVSAAASICRASHRRGDHFRLTTTADYDSGFGSDPAHLHKIYEYLALISPEPGSFIGAAERLGGQHSGGLVVAIAAEIDGTESGSLAALGSQFSSKTVVLFGEAEPQQSGAAAQDAVPGTSVVFVDQPSGFAGCWATHAASSEAPATANPPGAVAPEIQK